MPQARTNVRRKWATSKRSHLEDKRPKNASGSRNRADFERFRGCSRESLNLAA